MYIVVGMIVLVVIISIRVAFSATFIHCTNFRCKLLELAEDDPYWFGVYSSLPSRNIHMILSIFKDMHTFMSVGAQDKYTRVVINTRKVPKRKSKNDIELDTRI
ncbi:MAG TPA: hypothetical protein VFC79_01285 [Tissierellaceae bacterium]|nr:hypothetical protein [Tissierellaceae bacterium]